MLLEIIVRYLHFIGILGLAATLVLQFMSLKVMLAPEELRRLANIDRFYGFFAILTLAAGLGLWFGVGKSAEFYTSNWVFHLKLTLFVIAAGLSIAPTVFFIKHRFSAVDVALPKYIKIFKHVELTLIILLPLCAVIMSKGIGFFG